METRWFTFGFDHTHAVEGRTYDKDCVVKITAHDPRAVMLSKFGQRWAMEYFAEPNLSHFPRGVFEL